MLQPVSLIGLFSEIRAPGFVINVINSYLTNCSGLWPCRDESHCKSPLERSVVIGVSFGGRRRQPRGDSAGLCWLGWAILFYRCWRPGSNLIWATDSCDQRGGMIRASVKQMLLTKSYICKNMSVKEWNLMKVRNLITAIWIVICPQGPMELSSDFIHLSCPALTWWVNGVLNWV